MAKRKVEKKGPKGKKARRAAKLERQWGETVDEEEIQKARVRKGKSRLDPSSHPSRRITSGNRKKSNREQEGFVEEEYHQDEDEEFDSDDSDEESSSDDDNEMEEKNSNRDALNSLLRKIVPSSKKNRTQNDNGSKEEEASTSDDEDSSNSGDSDSHDTLEDDEIASDDDNDEQMRQIHEEELLKFTKQPPKGPNPLSIHFSKEPLKEEEDQQPPIKKKAFKKINTTQLNPNLILHASNTNDQGGQTNLTSQDIARDKFSHVIKDLSQNWAKINSKAVRLNADSSDDVQGSTTNDGTKPVIFSDLQSTLFPILTDYSDLQLTTISRANQSAIDNVLVLHILNHILSSAQIIASNNAKIKKEEEREEEEDSSDEKEEEEDDSEERRDQGYTRPKVLVLLPTRSCAWKFVQSILKMLGSSSSEGSKPNETLIENQQKFDAEFGKIEVDEEDNAANRRRKAVMDQKGTEWKELFGDDANDDDDFKIGLSFRKLSKKLSRVSGCSVATKLYSDFYHSDLIIASPLGLKMCLIKEDDEKESFEDTDFLSSIEILLASQSDVMLMQNWDHINSVLKCLNLQPKNNKNIDFSRVRNYLLSGQAARWRQTIVVSKLSDPHIMASFNRNSKSIAGQVKMRRKVPADEAFIGDVLTKVRQVFHRVPCESIAAQGDSRLDYFKDSVLPQLLRTHQKYTMIYVPSYFDFISVRNVLLKSSANFVSVTEYARVSEVSRGRARFLQGRKNILLYTGRAHFFSRHHIKGAKHLITFGLPEHGEFYPQLVNMLSEITEDTEDGDLSVGAPLSCLALFTKYDAHALERIVGTKHSERMIKGEKSSFLFFS